MAGKASRAMKLRLRISTVSRPTCVPEQLDRVLDHLCGLGPAGAAHGAGGGAVGHDRRDVDLDLGDRVHAAGHQRRQVGQERADAGVGTRVLEDLQSQRLHLAVAAAADLEVDPLRATLVHRHQVLAARLGPADGPAGGPRQPAEDHVLDREALAAEAAADIGRHDPHLLGLEAQRHRQSHLVLVRGLRRQPDGQPPSSPNWAAVARGSIGHAASRGLSTVPEATTSQPSNKFGVGVLRRVVKADVRTHLIEQEHLVAGGLARVGDHGQRVVVDGHQLGRVERGLARFGPGRRRRCPRRTVPAPRPETAGTCARRCR